MNTGIVRSSSFLKRCFSSNLPQLPACDYKPSKYKGPDLQSLINIRKKHISPCITTFYKEPLVIAEGHMQWIFNHEGKRYLDMFGGICTVSVGHCHPKVTAALKKQSEKLWHVSNIYMHEEIHEYVEMLTSKLPGNLKVVYLVNSGSEANDLAMAMARLYTGNYDLITLRNCYHGMVLSTMGLTSLSNFQHSLPVRMGIHHAMNPDPYQGIWGGRHCRDSAIQVDRDCQCSDTCEAAEKYYGQLEEIFNYSLPPGKVAGMFAESIQGYGGVVQFPKGFLKKAQELVHANKGIFISDEVQTGFGRLGDYFWGFESHGIVPDIVTMAKGIGNGFPMAAVVTTPEIAESLTKSAHFNTFGGNAMACAVGKAVLQVIDEEKTQNLCKEIGNYLIQNLNVLKEKFCEVGDVRGKGLMIGIELVQEGTKIPLEVDRVLNVIEQTKNMGLLVGRGGKFGNVLRIKPPMCITKEDADFTVNVLEIIFDKMFSKRV